MTFQVIYYLAHMKRVHLIILVLCFFTLNTTPVNQDSTRHMSVDQVDNSTRGPNLHAVQIQFGTNVLSPIMVGVCDIMDNFIETRKPEKVVTESLAAEIYLGMTTPKT